MKILALSDKVVDIIYTPSIAERLKDIDIIISCGDLPNYYLEFVVSILNKPLFYIFGNHHKNIIYTDKGKKSGDPEGCINLDNRIVRYNDLLIGGLEGSMRYSGNDYQYTDFQMCTKINRLKPRMCLNKIFRKKYIDILITHAPPYKIHDGEDLCHKGFKCFNNFIKKYRPGYLIHGHTHIYGPDKNWLTDINGTKVVNSYGFRILEL